MVIVTCFLDFIGGDVLVVPAGLEHFCGRL